jgi:hypothetical protein
MIQIIVVSILRHACIAPAADALVYATLTTQRHIVEGFTVLVAATVEVSAALSAAFRAVDFAALLTWSGALFAADAHATSKGLLWATASTDARGVQHVGIAATDGWTSGGAKSGLAVLLARAAGLTATGVASIAVGAADRAVIVAGLA